MSELFIINYFVKLYFVMVIKISLVPMKKIYLVFIFFSSLLFSQTTKSIDKEITDVTALFENGKNEEALKKLNYIISASEEVDYSKGRAYGYFNKAYYYYLSLNTDKSLQYIKSAEQENYTKSNPIFRCRVYDFLGQLCAKSNFRDEANRAFKNVISSSHEIISKNRGIYMEGVAYNNLASLHAPTGTDSMNYYTSKSYKLLISTPDRSDSLNILLSRSAANLGLLYKFKLKKDSSDYYFSKSLEYLPVGVKVVNGNKWFYKQIANVYYLNGLFEKSKEYNDMYTQYAENVKSLDEMEKAYTQRLAISDTLKTKDNYINLIEYANLQDKISVIKKNNNARLIKNIIDNKNTEIKKKKTFSTYLQAIIILILLISTIIGYYIRQYIRKKNLEKKRLLSEKQVEISELESKVNDSFEELVSLAKENSPNFLVRFQEVYPKFCKEIIKLDPNIQNSELEFCGYLRLNFSNKDIADFTFVALKTVHMRRYRLRKKFNIPPEQDIYLWMKNLDEMK